MTNIKEKECLLLIWRTKNSKMRLFIRSLTGDLSATDFKNLLSIHNRCIEPPDKNENDSYHYYELTDKQEKILLDLKSKLDLDDSLNENDVGWKQYEWDGGNPICNYNINVIICCGE